MSFTLRYEGGQFGPDAESAQAEKQRYTLHRNPNFSTQAPGPQSKTDKLRELFGNIGALVIRYHLGQGQRAGLLQQVSNYNYQENPVERVAKGENERGLFAPRADATPLEKTAKTLEKCAHNTLGRGKVLNSRAQPMMEINSHGLHGEHRLWDIMHSPVWTTGINLQSQLSEQGFLYVCCPKGFTEAQRRTLEKALQEDTYELLLDGTLFYDGISLRCVPAAELIVDLQNEATETPQANGLLISTKDNEHQREELGWMIHSKESGVVAQQDLEDLMRIFRIAKGGFYQLSYGQQRLLQSGRLKNENGMGLFTENQAFNAIQAISETLEKTFGFDPSQLIVQSVNLVYQRVQAHFKQDPQNMEDFLTGALLTEMVQPLRVSQPLSDRKVLPIRFTNRFHTSINNIRAIAYCYGLTDTAGKPVLRNVELGHSDDLIDVDVRGDLALPSLAYGRHAAAISSTALLVGEQLFLEQLMRQAVGEGKLQELLRAVLPTGVDPVGLANELQGLLAHIPQDDHLLPRLGAQYEYCAPIIEKLRQAFGFDELINLNCLLSIKGIDTNTAATRCQSPRLDNALEALHKIGRLLQKNEGTSGITAGSRGIGAGLDLLILTINPKLAVRLGITGKMSDLPVVPTTALMSARERALLRTVLDQAVKLNEIIMHLSQDTDLKELSKLYEELNLLVKDPAFQWFMEAKGENLRDSLDDIVEDSDPKNNHIFSGHFIEMKAELARIIKETGSIAHQVPGAISRKHLEKCPFLAAADASKEHTVAE